MINKLAKAQKSWIAKLILILTALSFMSLFGVSGYLSSAGNNRTVIKVDNIEIPQSEFSYQVQKDLNAAAKLAGDETEINDTMRSALILARAQELVQNAVLDRTAQKYDVAFRPALIQSLIVNQSAFKDQSGNFNKELFRRLLAENNLSEREYIAGIKRDLTKRILVEQPSVGFSTPKVLLDVQSRADNKRRTFKYVRIDPADMVVDRRISDEEVKQYYEDFSAGFMEPERRDVSVVFLSMEDILEQMEIGADEIKRFYDENKSNYETPQTRKVLQMMFESREAADSAYAKLQAGDDFYAVAAAEANQSREDTDLGFLSQDELIDAAAETVFALPEGGYTAPIQVEDNLWQIMQTAEIRQGSKVPYDQAAAEIIAELKDERLYDESYEIITRIEDKLGAGAELSEIAAELQVPMEQIFGLADDGSVSAVPNRLKDLAENPDFIDAAFSYMPGETSQVIDTDEGLIVVRVDQITETHPKELADVRGDIQKMWLANEKTAIAQEKVNDVMHDLENDEDLSVVAKRYGLKVYKSQPVTRNETFANIDYANVREMFADPLNTPRQIQQGEAYVVAVAVNDYQNSAPLDENEQNLVKFKAYQSLYQDFAEAMLKSFADEYKVKIKYNLMGLEY